ncbi:MAG: cyanophycin synthetase, partial [Patescibacteria group bacterium]
LASILASQGPTVATTANITPTYNIPTTILRCTPSTRYLILEMGIEYIGDMDFYTWLAHPDIAIITPINLTHTLFLNDLETVTSEKYKIAKNAKHVITYKDVKPETIKLSDTLIGSHFQINAALAFSAAKILNVPHPNLDNFVPPEHRMNLIKLPSGGYLIDDTYNANPLATTEALKALIETSKRLKKTPVFVFGQMNELGQYEKSAHEEIGLKIKSLNIKHLYCLGPATKHTIKSAGFGEYFETQEELYQAVYKILDTKYLILIKASRGWHFEDLVEKLV